jgi:hypothetical protein
MEVLVMVLRDILSDSFVYSFSNVNRLLFLGLLMVTSVFVVPVILAAGYFLRIMESSFNGFNELPPFNNWIGMFVDGLKYIIVDLVYLVIPVVLALILTLTLIPLIMDMDQFLMIFWFISLVLVVVPYFLMFIALPHMVYNKMRLSKAFDFKNLFKIIKKIGVLQYTTAIILITLLCTFQIALTLYLSYLPLQETIIYLINTLIQLTLFAYIYIFQTRLISNLYKKTIQIPTEN